MLYLANNQFYVRSLSEVEARPIPGTDKLGLPGDPVFSPDGRSVAFWSDGALKRIAVSGGASVTICQLTSQYGIDWDENGILFGQTGKGILRVSANGGTPEIVVSVKAGEQAYLPQMLPGGQAVLFTLATGTSPDRLDKTQIVAQSLGSSERKILIPDGGSARYLPSGHIVYALAGTLFAVPFDLRRLEVTGGPVPVVEGVRRGTGVFAGVAQFSVSNTGSLIYIPGPVSGAFGGQSLALIDRSGATKPLGLSPAPYFSPRVSPDGKRVAFGTDDGKEAIVWIYDLSGTSPMRRLTFGGANRYPIWSADGQRVAFQSDREGDLSIFWQRADFTGTAERLTKADKAVAHIPDSWSPDGMRFSFTAAKGGSSAVWIFSLGDKKATVFAEAPSALLGRSAFSPDGRWVAYQSNELGAKRLFSVSQIRTDVFVRPFPPTADKYQISMRSGSNDTNHHPFWSPDGKELFYIPRANEVLAVNVTTRPSFAFGNPVSVLQGFAGAGPDAIRTIDAMPDGKGLIGIVPAEQSQSESSSAPRIQIVLNWFEDLKLRVPVK